MLKKLKRLIKERPGEFKFMASKIDHLAEKSTNLMKSIESLSQLPLAENKKPESLTQKITNILSGKH